MTWKLQILLVVVLIASNVGAIEAPNIVGYMKCDINQGENIIPMPQTVGMSQMLVCDVLEREVLIDGDIIKAVNTYGDVVDVAVLDVGGVLVGEDELEQDADMYELPKIGDKYVLSVTRSKNITTSMCVSGAFNAEVPLRIPEITREIPLSKIRVDALSTQNLINKEFCILLRDGAKKKVRVDQDSRLFVDTKTGEPVQLDVSEIRGFELIRYDDIADVDLRKEVENLARTIVKKSNAYNRKEDFFESMLGVAFDKDNPYRSVVVWLVTTLISAGMGTFWTRAIPWVFRCARGCILRRKRLQREEELRSECIAHNAKAHFAQ